MKKMFLAMMGLVLLLVMGGCAGTDGIFGGGDYGKYADTLATHSTAEADRIKAQSTSISTMVTAANPQTAMEGTLLAVIGMMQVERLSFVPLPIQKPTTGMDVFNSIAGGLPMLYMGVSNATIAHDGFQAAGDMNSFGEGATLNDSMNKAYTDTTAAGSGASVATATAEPTIVEPAAEAVTTVPAQ